MIAFFETRPFGTPCRRRSEALSAEQEALPASSFIHLSPDFRERISFFRYCHKAPVTYISYRYATGPVLADVIDVGERQPRKLSADDFLKEARRMVEAGKVALTRHARFDHPERHITLTMMNKAILFGVIDEPPALDKKGNWKATIRRIGAGQVITVACAIRWQKDLLIITAY